MDHKGMTSWDVRFIARELSLSGGRIRKIYQYPHALLFEFFLPGKGGAWLRIEPRRMFLADGKEESTEPPQFCMLLRKHLDGARVEAVEQVGFERILLIQFAQYRLYVELIPPGNVIFCDGEDRIIAPLSIQRWKDRTIAPKEVYHTPPLQHNPFSLTPETMQDLFIASGKSLGSFLAVTLGFGGTYATEICARLGVPGKSTTLPKETMHIITEMDATAAPMRYADMVTPFPLTDQKGEALSSLSEGIGTFMFKEKTKEDRTEWIIAQQAAAKERLETKSKEKQATAALLYRHFSEIDTLLARIREEHKKGIPWLEIKKRIPGIDEHASTVTIRPEGVAVTLDFRLTAAENAAILFTDAKKAKEKLGRVESYAPRPKVVERTQEWYEQYRWFHTSDGFLVVGGKSATQNEEVFRKHIHPQDRVLHADIPGASLLVIQAEGKEVSAQALKEAAAFSAAQSRAWNRELGAIDVYAVRPEQVSKTPPSGMSLSKGSFFITGERQWFRNQAMHIAATLDEGKIVARPLEGAKEPFVVLVPGKLGGRKLAEAVQKALLQKAGKEKGKLIKMIPLSAFQQVLPASANLSQLGTHRK